MTKRKSIECHAGLQQCTLTACKKNGCQARTAPNPAAKREQLEAEAQAVLKKKKPKPARKVEIIQAPGTPIADAITRVSKDVADMLVADNQQQQDASALESAAAAPQQMTVIDRAKQILKFDERKAELATLAKESTRIVEIRDTVSYDECHSARMILKNTRIAIQATAKEAREDATAFSKAVIAKEKELIGVISPEEQRLEKIQEAWDAAREAEKAKKREAEEARIRAENALLDGIRQTPVKMMGKSSAQIIQKIEELEVFNITGSFDEAAQPRAIEMRDEALARIRELLAIVRDSEERERAMAAERAELEQLRAANAEKEAQLAKEREEADELAKRAASQARTKQEAEDRVRAEAERKAREKAETERTHIQNIRSIPLNLIGATVAALDLAIADAEQIDSSLEIEPGETLDVAVQAKADTVAKLKQMRDAQIQAEADRKASAEKAQADAEARRIADEAERQRAHDARMDTLKESAPPLPMAAIETLAALATAKLGDSDVAHRLQFAIERDRDVVVRLIKAYDALADRYEPAERIIDFARDYIADPETPTA